MLSLRSNRFTPGRFGSAVSPFELASEFEKFSPRALYVPGYGDFLSIGEIVSPAVSAGYAHATGPGGFARVTPASFEATYAFAPIGDSMRGSMVFAGHSLSAGTATQHTALSMARSAAGSAPIYRICASGSASPTGRMMFQVRNNAGVATNLIGARPIVPNAPMGVVTTCNGGSGRMSLYRDGNLEGIAAAPAEDVMTRNRFSVGTFGRIGNELPWDGGIYIGAVFADVLPVDVALEVSRDWRVLLKGAVPARRYFEVPAGATTVSADGVLRWSLTSAVHADQALRWSMNALAQTDATLMWSLLQTAQSDATARWSLISAISADATLRYSLVEAVQADAALRWSMLAAVSADIALLWDMAGATGVVSRDFAARWSMLAPVSADAAFHWSLLQAVARDQALPWNMVQTIATDRALRWSLTQAVQADADIAWSVLQAVASDATLAWDLASSLGTVGASLSLRWSLIAAVQQSIDARWSLLASVGADADMRWDIVAGVMRELALRWDLVTQLVAAKNLDVSWSLVAVSEADLVIRWQVGEVFDLVVRKRFVAGASICREFVA